MARRTRASPDTSASPDQCPERARALCQALETHPHHSTSVLPSRAYDGAFSSLVRLSSRMSGVARPLAPARPVTKGCRTLGAVSPLVSPCPTPALSITARTRAHDRSDQTPHLSGPFPSNASRFCCATKLKSCVLNGRFPHEDAMAFPLALFRLPARSCPRAGGAVRLRSPSTLVLKSAQARLLLPRELAPESQLARGRPKTGRVYSYFSRW